MELPGKTLNVAIIGARSFTARELIKIIVRHPYADVTLLQARVDEPVAAGETFSSLRGLGLPPITPINLDAIDDSIDAVFLCLPHTVSASYVIDLYEKNVRIFDLSADFRYANHRDYERVYGVDHPAPDLNRKAVYGMPELNRANITGAKLIACPGCYPTSVILGLVPLLKTEMIKPNSIIADCKSGVSGAGRTASDGTHYCNVNENFKPYKIVKHRHQSEIEEHLTRVSGINHTVSFVPHLVPMERGILSTIYAELAEPISEDFVMRAFLNYYRSEPFVRFLEEDNLPETQGVAHTNFCDIAMRTDERSNRLIIVTAIDNLIKGASGQAIQCMNISFALPESWGFFTDAEFSNYLKEETTI